MIYQEVNIRELFPVIQEASDHEGLVMCILFGGDRAAAAEHTLIARDGEKVAGIVTFSQHGETGEGPGVIGLWVRPEYRRRVFKEEDIAAELLRRAVAVLVQEAPGKKIRVDLTTRRAMSVCAPGRVGKDVADCLDVRKFYSYGMDLLELLGPYMTGGN